MRILVSVAADFGEVVECTDKLSLASNFSDFQTEVGISLGYHFKEARATAPLVNAACLEKNAQWTDVVSSVSY
jgi:hypothetical protein